MIAEQFQSSPTPLYVVLEGDVVSAEGLVAYERAIQTLSETEGVTGVPTGMWDTLEAERGQNPILDELMNGLDDAEGYSQLKAYLLEDEAGRAIVDSLLYIDGQQTIISFQANTLDWQATVDFEEGLSNELKSASSDVEGEFSMELSGRALILAQISADVAISAITSTAIVFHHFIRPHFDSIYSNAKFPTSSSSRWSHLDSTDYGGYVGLWNHGSCWLSIELSNGHHRRTGAWIGCRLCVHYVIRLEEEVELHPEKTVAQWTSKTTATTGRAMLGAAISTAGGFAILNFSDCYRFDSLVKCYRCHQPCNGLKRHVVTNLVWSVPTT